MIPALTPQHRTMLTQACSDLDAAKGLCAKCKTCGIDTTEMDAVIAELDSKAKALLQNFFPPLGTGQGE